MDVGPLQTTNQSCTKAAKGGNLPISSPTYCGHHLVRGDPRGPRGRDPRAFPSCKVRSVREGTFELSVQLDCWVQLQGYVTTKGSEHAHGARLFRPRSLYWQTHLRTLGWQQLGTEWALPPTITATTMGRTGLPI